MAPVRFPVLDHHDHYIFIFTVFDRFYFTIMLSVLSSWLTTISLIFGGCCSNAITLEQITLEHPNAGSVLTLFQFLIISLHGLSPNAPLMEIGEEG